LTLDISAPALGDTFDSTYVWNLLLNVSPGQGKWWSHDTAVLSPRLIRFHGSVEFAVALLDSSRGLAAFLLLRTSYASPASGASIG
jgi:hypothetical protein